MAVIIAIVDMGINCSNWKELRIYLFFAASDY